ncbi:MAG: 4-hydroxythreonine-4-phosphate dehydrogenase PdxA [Candidatus Tectomicrobia bacterium]|nr:4-hydroxythreonine-4-phosphate dehydrogenase PdxA [Candidatus Tectomicrobia bacterium]
MNEKPYIVITMGDPAGIGPEITVKALARRKIHEICRPVVIGTVSVLEQAIGVTNLPVKIKPIRHLGEGMFRRGIMNVLEVGHLDSKEFAIGKVSATAGKASMEYVEKALELIEKGEVHVMVNAPLNKQSTKAAGYDARGHLEFLSQRLGIENCATMLVNEPLRVVHLSTNVSLKEACQQVTKKHVFDKLLLTHESFKQFGFEHPHIGVAGLNPHAGDGGLLGCEEIEEIIPAIEEARSIGINVEGPFPTDSFFSQILEGQRGFDAAVAMYHDQGHLPVKLRRPERCVSVALGFPFVRMTVEHGTAFDIAGKNLANAISFEESMKVGVALVTGKGLSFKGR